MLLNIFDEWVKVKADNKESSRKWCKRHFLEEQRLYEMAKLKRQFRDILVDSGLLALDSEEEDGRRHSQRTDYTRRDLRRLQLLQAKERGTQHYTCHVVPFMVFDMSFDRSASAEV